MAQTIKPAGAPFDKNVFIEPSQPPATDSASVGSTATYTTAVLKLQFPASSRNNDTLARPSLDFAYLYSELGVQRLNAIHDYLWIAGRPMPPRPLHYQRAASRDLVPIEKMDLHLVWDEKTLYLKPIPLYLLNHDFWQGCLICKGNCACAAGESTPTTTETADTNAARVVCEERQLYECALGFLLSYAALIQYPSDFHIAQEAHLIPETVTWVQWVKLVSQLLDKKNRGNINKRYRFGELRLSRLNKIIYFGSFSYRGYSNWYHTYGSYFSRNLTPIVSAIAYITIILTAMQVGLATNHLKDNTAFQRASYGFTVFSIMSPLILGILVFAFFVIMFLDNLARAVMYKKKRFAMYDKFQAGDDTP